MLVIFEFGLQLSQALANDFLLRFGNAMSGLDQPVKLRQLVARRVEADLRLTVCVEMRLRTDPPSRIRRDGERIGRAACSGA